MDIGVDQSGKVECTHQDTVIAYANKKQKSIRIKAKDKRIIQQVFREAWKPYMFVYRTFAALLYLLIKDDLSDIHSIVIDREYAGKEHIIKHELLAIIRTHKQYLDPQAIQFGSVGKEHNAHKRALAVFRDNHPADMEVTYREVLAYVL